MEAELHLQRLLEWARREARAEAIEEARREGDEARERLFVMVTRMDGVAVADSIPERQLASRRNDGSKGRLPGASADGRRDSRSVAVRSRGTGRNHARDRVGAA